MLTSDALLRTIEHDLEALWLHGSPLEECIEAHAYPLAPGGAKRIRPLLVLLTAAAIGGEAALLRARPTAAAIELIHTYSLVHDDLPCMDNDALRRGRPTTHTLYGEAKGLLVGDGLLTHALFLVASRGRTTPWLESLSTREEACDVVETLTLAAGPYGMVGGQWLDCSLTQNSTEPVGTKAAAPSLTRDFAMVENIHRLKTGRLLAAALECGVVHGLHTLGHEGDETLAESWRECARMAGENIGIAFQIIDDLLDVTGTPETLGKSVGKDEREGKLTSVSTLGLDGAREAAAGYTAEARSLLAELDRLTRAGTRGAVSASAADGLRSLVDSLLTRSH